MLIQLQLEAGFKSLLFSSMVRPSQNKARKSVPYPMSSTRDRKKRTVHLKRGRPGPLFAQRTCGYFFPFFLFNFWGSQGITLLWTLLRATARALHESTQSFYPAQTNSYSTNSPLSQFGKQIQSQQTPGWGSFYVDYKGLKKVSLLLRSNYNLPAPPHPLPPLTQIINSLAKGRPADAALLAAGIRPPRPTGPEEPLHPSSEPQLIAHTAGVAVGEGEGSLLQVHKAAFFFKLERELEKVSWGGGVRVSGADRLLYGTQINAFYYQRESTLKVRLRTLIDKRKLLQTSLSDAQGKVKPLNRDSSSYGALYEGFRNFERDLGRLQVRPRIAAGGEERSDSS